MLSYSDGSTELVTVRLGKPEPVPGDPDNEWRCDCQIDGRIGAETFRTIGVDSMQALLLTIQKILPELRLMARDKGAKLLWLENADAGLPDYYSLSPHEP